jgi:hypothetical protein
MTPNLHQLLFDLLQTKRLVDHMSRLYRLALLVMPVYYRAVELTGTPA